MSAYAPKGELRYTSDGGIIYAIVVQVPDNLTVILPQEFSNEIVLLKTGEKLQAEESGQRLKIRLPDHIHEDEIPVLKLQEKS